MASRTRPTLLLVIHALGGGAIHFARLLRERLATPPVWMPTGHLPPLVADFYAREYLAPLCGDEPARST
jgi:hypothetical protein